MDMQLVARARANSGKGAARKIREQSRIPAICYGSGKEAQALSVSVYDFDKLIRAVGTDAKVIPLSVEGAAAPITKHVMIRDLQLDPVKHTVLHIDFYEVDMSQPVVVEIPIKLTGNSVGVENGGMLNQIRHSLTVRCLPGNIPEGIAVDISALDIGDSLHVEDLKSVANAEVVDEDHYTVVTVSAPATAAASSEEEGEEEEETIREGEEVTETEE